MPLSLVIARYFAYAVIAVGAVWLLSFLAFSTIIEAGLVYPASYGAAHARETAEQIAAADEFEPGELPTAYRYALLSDDGSILGTDLPEAQLAQAQKQLPAALEDAAENGGRAGVSGGNATTYAAAVRSDGTVCLLASGYLPEFASPSLRDSLPNPQNIWLAGGVAASLLAAGLVARRAGRVLSRKMEPLLDVADNVGKRNLDFSVSESNIREIGRVLAAMEEMRASLKSSLEAQWNAEQRQREQIAALAHDLKTPLTVIRANADFLAEETAASPDLADAASDAAHATEQLDRYVRLLIEASRGDGEESLHLGTVSARALCSRLADEAASVAKAAGIGFDARIAPTIAGMRVRADCDALVRAGMNAVANAVEHARRHVCLTCELTPKRDEMTVSPAPTHATLTGATGGSCAQTTSEAAATASTSFSTAESAPPPYGPASAQDALVIRIEDDGEGFSPEALIHGCERFWRADSSRTGDGHYGIGLATAADTVAAHGGALTLENSLDESGAIRGARVRIEIPLAERLSAHGTIAEFDPAL